MDTFKLIKSLSASEKRFIRLQSGLTEGDKRYMWLFDILDKSRDYKEEQVMDKYQTGISQARYSKDKNHLSALIIRHMNRYQLKHSAHLQISELIGGVKFLFDKGLYQQSRKTLNKARKLIDKYDLEPYRFVVLSWEKRLYEIGAYKQNESTAQTIAQASRKAMTSYLNTTEYSTLFDKITAFRLAYGRIRDDQARVDIQEVMESPLLEGDATNPSFNAEFYRLQTHFNYHELLGQWEQGIIFAEALVKLLEDHPDQLKIRYEPYISNLFLLIKCQMRSTQFATMQEGDWTIHETFDRNLQKLVQLTDTEGFRKVQTETLQTWHQTHLLHIKLNYCGMMLLFEDIVAMEEEIENFIDKFEHADSLDRLSFAANLSTAAFFCGDFRMSKKWIFHVLNNSKVNVRSDLYNFCRVFILLINFELGDYDQLEYSGLATQRHLRSKDAFFNVETTLHNFFTKEAPEFISDKKKQEGFLQLQQAIQPLMNDPHERRVFEIFNFTDWIQGHIEGRPGLEIARERQQAWKEEHSIPSFEEVAYRNLSEAS